MSESKPVRILYMEDDPGLARLFQKRLRRAGYVVDVAHDGAEGLAMYDAGSYDLVAVDQRMPIHDGLEVIRILASRGPLPPTIMITGAGSERIAVEAMKLGACDYIVKDVDGGYLDLVASVVERALHQQRLQEENQRAQEALRESEERYRTLVESQGEGVGIVDAEERFIFANPAAHDIFGVPSGALTGRNLREFVDTETFALVRAQTETCQTGKKSTYEMEIGRPDGKRRTLLVTATPRFDDEGQFTGTFGIFRDVSELKRVEKERERLIVELQEALARVKTLSGMLPICAHCKKIRDDAGYWHQVEVYIRDHSEAEFSHGICPECARKLFPDYFEEDEIDSASFPTRGT